MRKLDIIYEDENYVGVNKSAGVLTIPDRYEKSAENLFSILGEKYGKIYTAHRLDRDTSGAVVFAKNPDSHKALNDLFADRKVKKIYKLILSGVVFQDELTIDAPLAPHPSKPGITIPTARGKESLTIIRPIERFKNATYADCDLITGRRHQIRAHCASAGHPLMVDDVYGESSEFYLSSIKKKYNLKKGEEERPIITRLTMHAETLEFDDPLSGKTISVTAEFPKDFRVALQLLQKYASRKF